MFSIKLAINFDYDNLIDIELFTEYAESNKYYMLTEDEQQFIYTLGYKYFDPESVNLVDSVERVIIIKAYSRDINLENYIGDNTPLRDLNVTRSCYDKENIIIGEWLYNEYNSNVYYYNKNKQEDIVINRQNWPILVKDSSILFHEKYSWQDGRDNIKTITFSNEKMETGRKLKTMREMFMHCHNLENIIGLSNIDSSEVEDISYMLHYCEKIKDISFLKNFDTHNVKIMDNVFSYSHNIKSIEPLSTWDTHNVTMLSSMFNFTRVIDFSPMYSWNVSNVKCMYELFAATKITTAPEIGKYWKTDKLESMAGLFSNCYKLININGIVGLNISNVTNISNICENCYKLEDVTPLLLFDYSKFDEYSALWILSNADNIKIGLDALLETLDKTHNGKYYDDSIIYPQAYKELLMTMKDNNNFAQYLYSMCDRNRQEHFDKLHYMEIVKNINTFARYDEEEEFIEYDIDITDDDEWDEYGY